MDTTLTITAKGQVTLRREVLDHLGLHPGSKVVAELLPSGKVELRAAPTGKIEDLFGMIPSNGISVSIEEMNETIAKGWAGEE